MSPSVALDWLVDRLITDVPQIVCIDLGSPMPYLGRCIEAAGCTGQARSARRVRTEFDPTVPRIHWTFDVARDVSALTSATGGSGGQARQDAAMYRVTWRDEAGKELGQILAGDRQQAEQKIRAAVARDVAGSGGAYELDCPDGERTGLRAFIDNEMASSAAMMPATLDP